MTAVNTGCTCWRDGLSCLQRSRDLGLFVCPMPLLCVSSARFRFISGFRFHIHTHSLSIPLSPSLSFPFPSPTLSFLSPSSLPSSPHSHISPFPPLPLSNPQSSRRSRHTPQQPEGTGAAEPSLHDGCHSNSCRDVLPVHRDPGPHERVQSSGAERAERSPQELLVSV